MKKEMESNKTLGLSNSENENQNKQVFNLIEVKDTPFQIVESVNMNEDKEYRITLGGQMIAENIYSELKDALQYIESKPWELIINSAYALILKYNEKK